MFFSVMALAMAQHAVREPRPMRQQRASLFRRVMRRLWRTEMGMPAQTRSVNASRPKPMYPAR